MADDDDISIKVEELVAIRLEEIKCAQEREQLIERVGALEEEIEVVKSQIETFAAGYADLSQSVVGVESGQLSRNAKTRVMGLAAAGGGAGYGLIEMIVAIARAIGG